MHITRSLYRRLCLFALCALPFGCGRGNIEKGDTCLHLGDFPAAISFYDAELKRSPDSYRARLGMGQALLQKSAHANGDTALWKMALIHIEAARTLAPADEAIPMAMLLQDAYAQLAHMLLSAGDTIGSLAALSRAIEYNPRSVEPVNLAGVIYFKLGDTEKAIALFKKAIALDSLHPAAHFNLGMLYWRNGQPEQAHAHWLTALKLSPGDEDILYWFALAEKRLREKN
jgi:tetratricopeptide (TPR) repeat protein